MKKKLIKVFYSFIIGVSCISCAEDLNFDQFDDLEVTPTIASSFFRFETSEAFINAANLDPTLLNRNFNFNALAEGFVANRLLDGVITYELENTTSKPLEVTIDFVDATGAILDTEFFTIAAAPSGIFERQVAYGDAGKNIDILVNTASFQIRVFNQGDFTSVSAETDPRIIARSSGAFRLLLR